MKISLVFVLWMYGKTVTVYAKVKKFTVNGSTDGLTVNENDTNVIFHCQATGRPAPNVSISSSSGSENVTQDTSRQDNTTTVTTYWIPRDQIRVCRLPDCFAPTPKEKIDVCDQVVGTYAWAERLRWHRYHYLKNSDGEEQDPTEPFEKLPWYQPTTARAPKGDAALEAFIDACTHQFIDIKRRRRIRDNMTPGEREALAQLKNLPLTHNAACRYADKSGVTVITSLAEDDEKVLSQISDPEHYDVLPEDPTPDIIESVKSFCNKWQERGNFSKEIAQYVSGVKEAKPGNIKPLIKTHKPKPYPTRILLSGSGTPVQPLSKLIQIAIRHLTQFLPYQVMDTKEFLQKIEEINDNFAPLPNTACFAVCDVVALYPNVNNDMGVPATGTLLESHPSPLGITTNCILQALDIALNENCAKYEDGDGNTTYVKPNKGTAMGPCHSCDYVDVFM
ncbi:hypothetical protein BaRGS_00033687, partial [Batillaria attramentaria]